MYRTTFRTTWPPNDSPKQSSKDPRTDHATVVIIDQHNKTSSNKSSFLQYLPLSWPVWQLRAAIEPKLSLSQKTPIIFYTWICIWPCINRVTVFKFLVYWVNNTRRPQRYFNILPNKCFKAMNPNYTQHYAPQKVAYLSRNSVVSEIFFLLPYICPTAQMAEFMFQNVAYRATVYRTGSTTCKKLSKIFLSVHPYESSTAH